MHCKIEVMYRSHTCGELNTSNIGTTVTVSGWVQKIRDKGTIAWIDVRDRYGIIQIVTESGVVSEEVMQSVKKLGREFVVQITGEVIARESVNDKMASGAIEIKADEIKILNASLTPPFTIEDQTDGGEELRMQYRYLDLRRSPVQKNLMLRHKVSLETRKYMDSIDFMEVETPYLIKSTPEGARDFVVPSRMKEGEFYALP